MFGPVYKVIMHFDLFSFHISFVDCHLQSVSSFVDQVYSST
ncbi:hypothetical protein M6B38_366415 [Iris pallida]|uniref:Uncharacterized protein n=1 Tax=Iris pallida TaxID=29817 RepID=A0AAX6GG62_IRIPA|nr:hypothetical protein M6B38_366415 [Iris pallida]